MSGNIKTEMIMKKLFLVGTVALLAVGCQKENMGDQPAVGSVILTATVESDGTKVDATVNKDEKTVAFTWAKGDAIAVQTAGGYETFTLVGNGGNAKEEFAGNASVAAGAKAIFPAAAASVSADINLPAEYNYVPGQTNALLCATVDADSKMMFKHLGGLLSLELKGVPAGAKFVLTAEGQKINGAYSITDGQVNVVATENAAESTVTVKFAEKAVEAVVYVPLPVGEYTSLKAQVLAADGSVISEVAATETKSLGRKVLKAMPYMVVDLKDWFVSPEGAGDKSGSSWDNAMDQKAFNYFINYDRNGAEFTKEECEVFNGSTIYFKEGKYNFLAHADGKDRFKLQFTNMGKECYVTFLGGYASSSTGTDLTKRDAKQYVTKLTGDANNDNAGSTNDDTGIFCIDNWAFLTFDGITFTCAGGKADNKWKQGAFVTNSDNYRNSLTITNCVFKDLYSSDKSTTSNNSTSYVGYGAAIYANANCAIKVSDCQFESCNGNHVGGAITLGVKSSTLEIERCSFKACKALTTYGGAIASGEGAPMTIKNCTFEGCTSGNHAGALYGNKGAIVNVENCTFTACQSGNGGGAACFEAHSGNTVANLKNCTFDSCVAASQGIIYSYKTATVNLDNCTFKNCTATKDGGALAGYAPGVVFNAKNCTFDACKGTTGMGGAVLLQAGPIGKFDGCTFKNCQANNRGGAFRILSGKVNNVNYEPLLFMNDCALYNNTTTGDWGGAIASSSGHLLINNSTFADNYSKSTGTTINGGGCWVIVNSTITVASEISDETNTPLRNESGTPAFIMNSMVFYYGSHTDADDSAIFNNGTRTFASEGYNIYNTYANFTPHSTDVTGQPMSAYGLTLNTDHYVWNGPAADRTNVTLAQVEEALKTKCNHKVGDIDNIGLEFYNWLQSLESGRNPLAYDQKGNARNTSSMWPGAYEKH